MGTAPIAHFHRIRNQTATVGAQEHGMKDLRPVLEDELRLMQTAGLEIGGKEGRLP
jgi:hypothetical protein